MEALSSLVREHQFIDRLVAALDFYASLVERGADVEPADLRGFTRALREYAKRHRRYGS